jgi:hypothetical protein
MTDVFRFFEQICAILVTKFANGACMRPRIFLQEFNRCINKNAEVCADFESVKAMEKSSHKECLTENKVLKVKNSDFLTLFHCHPFWHELFS